MSGAMENLTTSSYRYGGSFLLDAVQSFQQEEKAAGRPRDELKMYLESGIEHTTNVIQWWGVRALTLSRLLSANALSQHQADSKYPTMKRIARDYLAIQGSATPSERAFSSGGITDTARRNRLSPEAFEALQILKSAYRNGHVGAVHQAAQHIDARISTLDDTDVDSGGEGI
jgi:hypothetical protein